MLACATKEAKYAKSLEISHEFHVKFQKNEISFEIRMKFQAKLRVQAVLRPKQANTLKYQHAHPKPVKFHVKFR